MHVSIVEPDKIPSLLMEHLAKWPVLGIGGSVVFLLGHGESCACCQAVRARSYPIGVHGNLIRIGS